MALCALARPHPPRPAGEDRGAPAINVLVLATLVVASPPVRPAFGDSGPRLTAAPEATADWLAANPQPGRIFDYQAWAPPWSSASGRGWGTRWSTGGVADG